MKKLKRFIFMVIVCVMFAGSGVYPVLAAGSSTYYSNDYDFSAMTDQEFIRYLAARVNQYLPHNNPSFSDKYHSIINKKYGKEYPWESATDEELQYMVKHHMVNHGKAGGMEDAFYIRMDRYNREHGVYEEWARQQEISMKNKLEAQNRRMWENSMLVGDANSHGALTQKDNSIYQRKENGTTISGIELGADAYNMDEPSGVTKVIMEFLCWLIFMLADQLDSILTTGGIALDNVIFGRVAGYGVMPANETDYITLFGFELNPGNPYGFVGAILFQRLRSYVYVFMAIYCLFKMVRIAISGDYYKMKMDFSSFLQNALLAFTFIVMMPYIFDMYLYIRDVLIKAVTFGTLQDLFGTTGFLASFRAAAESSSLNLVPNLMYLGAVILSLVVAGLYVAYAMCMMVHFIFFPFICLRGIGNSGVYKEWAMETLGLTIMPLVDGMLLIIPLTFSDMANGNIAFNLLSLVSCGMLLTARKQARRSLGIKENGLDMGALATVMGLGHMLKGVGKTVGRMGKKIGAAGAAAQAAKEDANMADMYEQEGQNAPLADPGASDASAGAGGAPGSYSGISLDNLREHANINNFESGPFRGNLDNETMARLYRQRARKRGFTAAAQAAGAVGSGIGGMAGATVGYGAGAFMGNSMQAFLAGTGMDVGSAFGGFAAEKGVGAAGIMFTNLDDRSAVIEGKKDTAEVEKVSGTVDGADQTPVVYTGGGGAVANKNDNAGTTDDRVVNLQTQLNVNKTAYGESAVQAASNLENTDKLKNDPEFESKINSVKSQMEAMVERAQNGEHPDVIINGAGGLSQLKGDFSNDKAQRYSVEFSTTLANRSDVSYSGNPQTNADAVGAVVEGMTRDVLSRKGRFMSDDYDKTFGIEWDNVKQQIISEGSRHGHTYSGK